MWNRTGRRSICPRGPLEMTGALSPTCGTPYPVEAEKKKTQNPAHWIELMLFMVESVPRSNHEVLWCPIPPSRLVIEWPHLSKGHLRKKPSSLFSQLCTLQKVGVWCTCVKGVNIYGEI